MTNGQREFKDYPRPSLAVDPAVMTVHDGRLWTILWRRQNAPQQGYWALPGAFVNEGEELEAAVARALRTKANLDRTSYVEQLFAWNKVGRDPRGWVITVAYFALLPQKQLQAAVDGDKNVGLFALEFDGSSSGRPARVVGTDGRPVSPAFDHAEILGMVVRRLRERLWHSPVVLALLPERFTLHEMRTSYEAILGRSLNKDSFRRKVTNNKMLIQPTGEYQQDVDHRPAELFARTIEL